MEETNITDLADKIQELEYRVIRLEYRLNDLQRIIRSLGGKQDGEN